MAIKPVPFNPLVNPTIGGGGGGGYTMGHKSAPSVPAASSKSGLAGGLNALTEAMDNYQKRKDKMEERAYQRSRDSASDDWREKQWDYNVGRDEKSDKRADREYDYRSSRDKKGDEVSENTRKYNRGRDAQTDARTQASHDVAIKGSKLSNQLTQFKLNKEIKDVERQEKLQRDLHGKQADGVNTMEGEKPKDKYQVIRGKHNRLIQHRDVLMKHASSNPTAAARLEGIQKDIEKFEKSANFVNMDRHEKALQAGDKPNSKEYLLTMSTGKTSLERKQELQAKKDFKQFESDLKNKADGQTEFVGIEAEYSSATDQYATITDAFEGIHQVLDQNDKATGPIANLLKGLPGTDAQKIESKLKIAQIRIALKTLKEQNLAPVSDTEFDAATNSLGNITVDTDIEVLRETMNRVQGLMNRSQDMSKYKYEHAQWKANGSEGEPPKLPERLEAFREETMRKLDNSYAVDEARKSGMYKHIPNDRREAFRKDPAKWADNMRKELRTNTKVFKRFSPETQAKVLENPIRFFVLANKARQAEEAKKAGKSWW